mgnify:CR=1 FL=1
MEITEFLAIGVVGGLLSLLIEWVTNKFGTNKTASKAVTLALALVVGGGYVWLRSTPYWETALIVLGAASTVYAFFIKK